MRFAKAHGLGNDFLIVESRHCPLDAAPWARRLCERHVGIGADGVLVYALESDGTVMRLLNADGSEAEISGNGLRCLAAYTVWKGWLPECHVVHTVPGTRPVGVEKVDSAVFRVATELGPAVLRSADIPMALSPEQELVVDHPLTAAGRELRVTATSLGNPHCAVFLDQPADDALIASLGPALETHPVFPRRTNVEFVTVLAPDELRVRFWERGVGPTSASGTGAASAVVAAALANRAGRRARVVCDGGVLEVEWPPDGPVRQVGVVEVLFEGDWLGQ